MRTKKLILAFAAVILGISTYAQSWTLDKAHSKLGFEAGHLLISNVDGYFKSFEAKITTTKPDFTDAMIELTADVNSVNTDDDKRDNHLKSPDFFDAVKYNTLTFKSSSFVKTSDNGYKLLGNLTIHGITKPVVLEVTYGGTAVHPFTKKTMSGFKVKGSVKRTDFAIGSSIPSAIVSDEILITANTEFAKD